jgi:U5 small nuclear ribonucleoprotein component
METDEYSLVPINEQSIVLHEDKRYYPEASELYGDETEIVIGDEDAQTLETPIITPIKESKFGYIEKSLPETSFDYSYMHGMMEKPNLVRNIALIG